MLYTSGVVLQKLASNCLHPWPCCLGLMETGIQEDFEGHTFVPQNLHKLLYRLQGFRRKSFPSLVPRFQWLNLGPFAYKHVLHHWATASILLCAGKVFTCTETFMEVNQSCLPPPLILVMAHAFHASSLQRIGEGHGVCPSYLHPVLSFHLIKLR